MSLKHPTLTFLTRLAQDLKCTTMQKKLGNLQQHHSITSKIQFTVTAFTKIIMSQLFFQTNCQTKSKHVTILLKQAQSSSLNKHYNHETEKHLRYSTGQQLACILGNTGGLNIIGERKQSSCFFNILK